MPDYIERLSRDWIDYFSISDKDEIKKNKHYNPFEIYDLIVRNDPLTGWRLIVNTINKDTQKKSLRMLAAGPLEDFISIHGINFIELIEDEARINSELRWILGGVWKGSANDEIWHRIERIRGDTW